MNTAEQRAANAYTSTGLQTRMASKDPHQLVTLMFETILQSVANARGALKQGDLIAKVKAIDKAIRILHEGLRTGLDLDQGGELAANLAALYDYCILKLTQANVRNDDALLAEVVSLIRPVAEGWSQIRPGLTQAAEQTVTAPEPVPPAASTGSRGVAQKVGALYSTPKPANHALLAGA